MKNCLFLNRNAKHSAVSSVSDFTRFHVSTILYKSNLCLITSYLCLIRTDPTGFFRFLADTFIQHSYCQEFFGVEKLIFFLIAL